MKDAVVFIHRGESWYLYHTVKQARARIPNADIFVIADCEHPDLSPYATVLPLGDYWKSAAEFAPIYRHFSTNDYNFELFCFQRWFVVSEFVAKHRPNRLIHLDSDLLVYDNISREFDRLAGADLALVSFQGPFSLLLPQPAIVNRLCERIIRLYTEELAAVEAMFNEWRRDGRKTAISDMHALHTFVSGANLRAVDLGVEYDGSVYDNVIHDSGGYQLENGFKKLRWDHRQPYVQNVKTGDWVRLKTIHCQGPSKAKILNFFTEKDLAYWRDKAVAALRPKLNRLYRPTWVKART